MSGYDADPKVYLKTVFEANYDDFVLVRNITFFSLCEHHLLPFYGTFNVAYIPNNGQVVGLSKVARVVETYSRRLQLQERLTDQIAFCFENTMHPKGIVVIGNAEHLCMAMRGIQKPGSRTITRCALGAFRDQALQQMVINLIDL